MLPTVRILCGDETVADALEATLPELGVAVDADAAWCLLVDKPLGWASLEHDGLDANRTVVASDNPCPTYQLDLLDRNPAALVSLDPEAVPAALSNAARGGRVVPQVSTPLTPAERRTLRLVAQGYSNKEIARRREVNESTVKNSLYEIYRKLDLKSRVQAAHYYFGNWHLLRGWTPPAFLT